MADILHIDDDPDMRALVRCILKEHRVTGVASAPEALARLARGTPDLLLVDLDLSYTGNPDGGRALARLAVGRGLPTLILSACPDAPRLARELDVPCLVKPFAPADLRRAAALALAAGRVAGGNRASAHERAVR